MNIKRLIIVAGGEFITPESFFSNYQETDIVIAADSGYNFLSKIDVIPNILIGDLDSVNEPLDKIPQQIEIIAYSKDKDLSDLELAIQYAIKNEYTELIILGAIGTYIDHSFSNILLLTKYSENNITIRLVTPNSIIVPFRDALILNGFNGQRFSFFPLEPINDVVITGADYHFKTKSVSILQFSLSNRINNDTFSIKSSGGKGFVVIFSKTIY